MTQQNQTASTIQQPRLDPIDDPEHLKVRMAYWLAEQQMGTVITPLKVLYARFPQALGLAKKIAEVDEKIPLDRELKYLVKTYVATLNGCAFCIDIAKAYVKSDNLESNKFNDLLRFEESEVITQREKAALSYADEATRNKHVSDSTFERLQEHFTEEEIVQLTLLNAIENYYNLTNAPLNIGSDELCELWN